MKKLLPLIFVLIERVILDQALPSVLAGRFAPYTLVLDQNYTYLWPSIIGVILVVTFLPTSKIRPSSLVAWLFVVVMYVPLTSVYWLSNGSTEWFLINTGFWIILALLLRFKLPNYRLKGGKISFGLIYALAASLFFAVSAISFRAGTFGINVNLIDAYTIRKQFYGMAIPGMVYITNALALVVAPLVTLHGVETRSYSKILLGIMLGVFLYSVAGQKGYLFAPFLSFGMFMLDRVKWRYLITTCGMCVLLGLSWFMAAFFANYWLISLAMNRALVLPAVISFYYYDYFSNFSPLLMSQSAFVRLSNSNISMAPANIIGGHYFGNFKNYANTGLIADAFTNFGTAGILVICLFFYFLLALLDKFYNQLRPAYFYGLFSMPLLFLINAPLQTDVLTGGMGLAMVIAWSISGIMKNKYKMHTKNMSEITVGHTDNA